MAAGIYISESGDTVLKERKRKRRGRGEEEEKEEQ